MILEHGFSLAEGPVYDVRNRCLYFVDILGHRLHVRADSGERLSHDLGDFVTSVHLTDDVDTVLVTTRSSLFLFDVQSGRKRHIITVDMDESMRFNDGAAAPDGSLWMGSMRIDPPRTDEGKLYRITSEGWTVAASGFGIANGLAFLSPDTFVHVDSARDIVRKCQLEDGQIRTLAFHQYGGCCPDGLCLASSGEILVALWNIGEVSILDSEDLEEKGSIPGFKTSLSSVALTDDGRLYLTSGEDENGSGELVEIDVKYKKGEENIWKTELPL